MVDAHVSGACEEIHKGSSPFFGIINEKKMKNRSELTDILKKLKTNYFAETLKAEALEDLTREDVENLKELADDAQMGFTLKVGGSEAYRDTKFAKEIGIRKLVVPMIESAYALEKFITVVEEVYHDDEFPEIYANIETFNGAALLDEILNAESCQRMSGIIFGRTDMCGSLGLTSQDVDNDEIYQYALSISNQVAKCGKPLYIGGRVSPHSISFFKNLHYMSGFETKKILFNSKVLNTNEPQNAILAALEFELLWLQSKEQTQRDLKRIEIIKRRITLK